MRLLVAIVALLCSGCTLTYYRDGQHCFTRLALGANTQAQTLQVSVKPDGTKELKLGGYEQKQDEAFGAAAEGVTKAAIQALSPVP